MTTPPLKPKDYALYPGEAAAFQKQQVKEAPFPERPPIAKIPKPQLNHFPSTNKWMTWAIKSVKFILKNL